MIENGTAQLTFRHFAAMNNERHVNWPHNGNGNKTSVGWGLSEWGCAVAEEAGEVCGAIKRINRLRSGQIGGSNQPVDMEEALLRLKKEIGDVVTYLDLLAQEAGSSLEECTRLAYNGVSEREGMSYKI